MLQRTFLHLQGVGESVERRIWSGGFWTWDDFLTRDLPPRWAALRPELLCSRDLLTQERWSELDRLLPGGHRWRAWPDLRDRAVFVDIETDGGTSGDSITVIGCHDRDGFKAFVAGENLEEAAPYLASFPLWITYNGAQFDVPLIRDRLNRAIFNHIHIDLRFPLRRLGYRGGLKAIEQAVGLQRSDSTRGMGGWEAVELWREWRRGSGAARERLLAYNREDVENLRPLMELTYRELTRDWP